MAGKSVNSFGAKNWAPNSPATRYNASGKNREFYTFENAPGLGNYATGGTIIDGGDGYIYHIFTGDGTFAVNRPTAAIDSVDYLVVAGGGAGGAGSSNTIPGGGGGGGGMLFGNIDVSPGPYPISVGGGGASNGRSNPSASRHGFNSAAFGLTAEGGGGGGCPGPSVTHSSGDPGGSGGGASSSPPTSGRPGGTGNTPATIPRQGYPAAPFSMPTAIPPAIGGGGGGAGGAGGHVANGDPVGPPYIPRGYGGPGRLVPQFPIPIIGRAIPSTNYPVWYNDVAEGSTYSGNSGGGLSAGGRAWAPPSNSSPQLNATANTGHGGIGQTTSPGFNGGSGIVCIRYKKNPPYSRATGGTIEPSTHPEHPGVWRHIFTEPGTFEVTDPTLQYIDYLAVGGGGGGGGGGFPHTGGGGGGGGFVSSIHTSTTTPTSIPEAYPWNPGYSVRVGEQYPVGVGTYPVIIGAGGTTLNNNAGSSGGDTTIGSSLSQIIAYGGGGGGVAAPFTPVPGLSGGSGGGSAKGISQPGPIAGGAASPSPLIQGNAGGDADLSTPANAGGGGGAGASGGIVAPTPSTTPVVGGVGGDGWYSVLSPSAYGTPGPISGYRYFSGGGGGSGGLRPGVPPFPGPGGAGGAGGGGGGIPGAPSPSPGITNTGGGGGGTRSPTAAGTGGSGIVIIQYPE